MDYRGRADSGGRGHDHVVDLDAGGFRPAEIGGQFLSFVAVVVGAPRFVEQQRNRVGEEEPWVRHGHSALGCSRWIDGGVGSVADPLPERGIQTVALGGVLGAGGEVVQFVRVGLEVVEFERRDVAA